MKCQKCKSQRILHAGAHCSDMGYFQIGDQEHNGYVPEDLGIGGGDDMEIDLCLDCGQVQGQWPLPTSRMERKSKNKKVVTSPIANSVVDVVINTNNGDTAYVLGLIMEGWLTKPIPEIVNQVADCVNALKSEPKTQAMGLQVQDALEAWEHWRLLEPLILDESEQDDD